MNNKTSISDYLEEEFLKSLETDLEDAKYIFDFFSFFANNPEYDNKSTRKRALRECIQHEWQTPRLTSRVKTNLLWSQAARELYFSGNHVNKLVLEHTRPMADVTNYFIEKIRAKEINSPDDMLKYLKAAHKGPVMVIITKEEDRLLLKASSNGSIDTPLHSIITERYKEHASKIVFMPLEQDERFTNSKKA